MPTVGFTFHTVMAESWKLRPGSKLCFVTTGATAPFTALIESTLSPSSLQALRECGFTHILVQYGTAKDVFARCSSAAVSHLQDNSQEKKLSIAGFDFDSNALQPQFKLVQKTKGLVVSHAGTFPQQGSRKQSAKHVGSGTILAALRYQIPLVVVPNTGLLDNHQEELAVAMERNRYLLRGDVQYVFVVV